MDTEIYRYIFNKQTLVKTLKIAFFFFKKIFRNVFIGTVILI